MGREMSLCLGPRLMQGVPCFAVLNGMAGQLCVEDDLAGGCTSGCDRMRSLRQGWEDRTLCG